MLYTCPTDRYSLLTDEDEDEDVKMRAAPCAINVRISSPQRPK